jgi:exosortase
MGLQNQDFINLSAVKQFLRTGHGKVVLMGMLIGLIYLPRWIWSIATFTFTGAIFPFATVAAASAGLTQLWHDRYQLMQMDASPIDRRIGHFMIWFSLALFPFCQTQMWAKAVLWSIVLAAIALSSWGLKFFKQYWLYFSLLLFGSYPSSFHSLLTWTWKHTAPPETLERLTAWGSGSFLSLFSMSVTVEQIHVLLPTGGVSVYEGCNGFEMIATMLTISILTGIAFQMHWVRTLFLTALSIILALSSNFARIALMTIAVAYWGEQSFEFWHGFWGGQIFAGLLFTIYYYLVMTLLPNSSNPPNNAASDSSNLQ